MAIQAYEYAPRDGQSTRCDEFPVPGKPAVRPLGFPTEGSTLMLPLDITEDENEFVLKMSMPGVIPEDVHITAHGHDLTIRGEIRAEQERKDTHWHVREPLLRPIPTHGHAAHDDQPRPGSGQL